MASDTIEINLVSIEIEVQVWVELGNNKFSMPGSVGVLGSGLQEENSEESCQQNL